MLEIEIVEANIIEGGIEVFARAWRDGVQLGFGKDGTIDLERFRFFNPPILVEDINGSIVRENIDPETSEIKKIFFTEDPALALQQSLSHTINLVAVSSENIVFGKRGSTVDTFYSGSGDGGILGYQTESTPTQALWDELHDATTLGGTTAGLVSTATTFGDTYAVRNMYKATANGVQIGRAFFPVDTSSLPDTDTIDSATFSVYGKYTIGVISLGLVQTSQASVSALTVADFDTNGDAVNNPTEGASRVSVNSATEQYWDWTLNATGLSWVSKTGYTMLGLRSGDDMDDTLPSSGTEQRFYNYYSDSTGTANDPKLVVTHSAGGGPTANNSARRLHMMSM